MREYEVHEVFELLTIPSRNKGIQSSNMVAVDQGAFLERLERLYTSWEVSHEGHGWMSSNKNN